MNSRKCGKSAVDYLTFQRHLMYISGCMTVISLLGPLPANTMGKLLIETNAYFAKTTIGNLSVDNILIWGCFQTRIDSRTKLSVFRVSDVADGCWRRNVLVTTIVPHHKVTKIMLETRCLKTTMRFMSYRVFLCI